MQEQARLKEQAGAMSQKQYQERRGTLEQTQAQLQERQQLMAQERERLQQRQKMLDGEMISFLKNAAAPCALFTMGVTVALRPLKRVPFEMPALMVIKILIHPLAVWVILSWIGDFGREWTFTAVLMAALPPALERVRDREPVSGLCRARVDGDHGGNPDLGRDGHRPAAADRRKQDPVRPLPWLRGHDAAGTMPLEWHPVPEHGMPQPLSNIFVLDFSTLLPGPMATLMLAEAGAEVVKVEKPGGEDMQRFEPRIGETSAPYAVLNRGKSILTWT